nr:hypothetical protein [Wolbachia endosymbiont of Frankliniella intonsa]
MYPNVDFYSGIIMNAIGILQVCLHPFLHLFCKNPLVGLPSGMKW